MSKKLVAEFLGTFCLVFAGTGAIVIDTVSGGGFACGSGAYFWSHRVGDDLHVWRYLWCAH
jgi:glycerol uptake facilitator-like aquaporin